MEKKKKKGRESTIRTRNTTSEAVLVGAHGIEQGSG